MGLIKNREENGPRNKQLPCDFSHFTQHVQELKRICLALHGTQEPCHQAVLYLLHTREKAATLSAIFQSVIKFSPRDREALKSNLGQAEVAVPGPVSARRQDRRYRQRHEDLPAPGARAGGEAGLPAELLPQPPPGASPGT